MNDFLRGTIGCFLQGILVIAGFVFLTVSFVSCLAGEKAGGGLFLVLAILCFCAGVGIRYWLLGHIFRR